LVWGHIGGRRFVLSFVKEVLRLWVDEAKLTLAQRTFLCDACDLVIDRDLNAARNLARLAQSVAQSDWETQNARGADVGPGVTRRSALKREAGTRFLLGQTGIVGV
jgi:putative transposase